MQIARGQRRQAAVSLQVLDEKLNLLDPTIKVLGSEFKASPLGCGALTCPAQRQ